jgi:hypothetical protein
MRQRIELETIEDVRKFNEVASTIEEDVTLVGYDENGSPWSISGKSILASLIVLDESRKCSARNVDWNTIYCECERDIYTLIKPWAVGSQLEP